MNCQNNQSWLELAVSLHFHTQHQISFATVATELKLRTAGTSFVQLFFQESDAVSFFWYLVRKCFIFLEQVTETLHSSNALFAEGLLMFLGQQQAKICNDAGNEEQVPFSTLYQISKRTQSQPKTNMTQSNWEMRICHLQEQAWAQVSKLSGIIFLQLLLWLVLLSKNCWILFERSLFLWSRKLLESPIALCFIKGGSTHFSFCHLFFQIRKEAEFVYEIKTISKRMLVWGNLDLLFLATRRAVMRCGSSWTGPAK